MVWSLRPAPFSYPFTTCRVECLTVCTEQLAWLQAVYEEKDSPPVNLGEKQPLKKRYLSQIVTPSSPRYISGAHGKDYENYLTTAPQSPPMIGVSFDESSGIEVTLLVRTAWENQEAFEDVVRWLVWHVKKPSMFLNQDGTETSS